MTSDQTQPERKSISPGPIAWIPLPLLLAAIIVARLAGWRQSWESPSLTLALSFTFYTVVSLATLYIVGRNFLKSGSPGLLMLECGVIFWSLAGTIGDAVSHGNANVNVTIFNTGILLAGLCHLAGVIHVGKPYKVTRLKPLYLVAGIVTSMGMLWLVAFAALSGRLPVFFVPGHGGTTVRYFVLLSAICTLGISAGLLYAGHRAGRSTFASWYARALLLMAVGLFGVMIQLTLGSALNWLGRTSQWLGGVYLLMAALASMREWHLPLLPDINKVRPSYHKNAMAIALVLAFAAFRLAFLSALGMRAPFVIFFPAVILAALYGGLRSGLIATALSALLADYFWIEPAGSFTLGQLGDRLALTIFVLSSVMAIWVIEVMRSAQKRAASAETQALLSAEREAAAEALRKGEEKYRLLVEHAPSAIYEIDFIKNRFSMVNEGMCKMTGYPEAELLAMSPLDILDKNSLETFRDRMKRAGEGEAIADVLEYKARRKDGSELWGMLHTSFRYDQGKIVGAFVVAHDITERRKMEQDLKIREEMLLLVLNTSIDGIIRFNYKTGVFDYVSPSIGRMLGYPMEELSTWDAAKMNARIHPDDIPGMLESIKVMEETGEATAEYRERRKDGTYVWLSNHMSLVRDQGRPLYRNGSIRDITERKKAEDALRESEARFRSVLDNSQDVIYRVNVKTGLYEYISPSCESVVGYSPEELTKQDAQTAISMIHPDDVRAFRAAQERLKETGSAKVDYRQRTKNGDFRWLSNHMSLTKDETGALLYRSGNIRDVTPQKLAEEAIRLSEANLRGILDATRESIWVFGADGTMLLANPTAISRLGRPAHEIIGKRFSEANLPNEPGRIATAFHVLSD